MECALEVLGYHKFYNLPVTECARQSPELRMLCHSSVLAAPAKDKASGFPPFHLAF